MRGDAALLKRHEIQALLSGARASARSRAARSDLPRQDGGGDVRRSCRLDAPSAANVPETAFVSPLLRLRERTLAAERIERVARRRVRCGSRSVARDHPSPGPSRFLTIHRIFGAVAVVLFALTTRPTFSLRGRALASMGARGDPVSDGKQTATFRFDGERASSRRRREERLMGKGGDAASRWRRRTLAFAFGRVGAEQRRFAALWGSAPAPGEGGRDRRRAELAS
jgi:hypothetical protein